MMSFTSRFQVMADLHLHSPYSRAVSKLMTLPEMSYQAHRRGIDLLATGDWTHPAWFQQLDTELTEWQPGIYASRQQPDGAKFLLSTEISCIFSQGGRVRRIHLLIFAPNLAVVSKINGELEKRGVNIRSDGRPIMGLSCIQVMELVLGVSSECLVIPAHAWTPWFGVLGSKGGFDSLAEAFGPYEDKIYAIETGLSSDPLMNWRVGQLDSKAIVSFGDAHSPAKMGRELTAFRYISGKQLSAENAFSYTDICQAIGERATGQNEGQLELDGTVEFYPEEGKYHWDGHRACGVVQTPAKTRELGTTCPVCGKTLTVGVEFRVEELATRPVEGLLKAQVLESQVLYKTNALDATRPGYINLVPLQEIIAEVRHKGVGTKGVTTEYQKMLDVLGDELTILLKIPLLRIAEITDHQIAQAILQVRRGEVTIQPGYDGVYGEVSIESTSQESLF